MNEALRRYLVSSLTTFLATFFTVIGAQLMATNSIEFTWPFIVSIVLIAARAAVKAVVEAIPVLGGKADRKR